MTITSAPAAQTRSSGARLTFTVDDPNATVLCSVDGGAASACTSPVDLSSLADGSHDVTLHAVDPDGTTGPSVHTSFTVDNTAPHVAVVSSPPSPSASSTVSVGFSVDDSTAQAWCSLDGAAAQTCSSPVAYSGLSDGAHSIAIYAVDPAGNRSATVTATVTVAHGAPVITTRPGVFVFGTARYSWNAVPGLTYEYSYDGVTWRPTTTTSSNTSNNLVPGTYTFRLRGVDSGGNVTAVTTAPSFFAW